MKMRAFLGFPRGFRTAFQKAENIALIFRGLSPPVSPRWKLVTGPMVKKLVPVTALSNNSLLSARR
jgi:hypothetical protein